MDRKTPTGRPQKHSLTLHGHRTSVSLEPAFWQAFLQMARDRGLAINALAAEVDAQRAGSDQGLATAIRLSVLRHLQDRLAALGRDPG
ncbi:ribbon-helix-helix domain-containing protein [Stagnihabitans tardus]|uniref:Aryl-sulfate sulfotransferase n=1 Tax=Stagnihabitans tardus TaxID=2699202 RepID=A0AAE5BSH4_9RHOB|nr:ribbon-helix-helix domain-containing protein [Stagnihabitans tardus]NBZ87845.1 aryl-sulfate sulfotransferase [Stagnihabitans tardus]